MNVAMPRRYMGDRYMGKVAGHLRNWISVLNVLLIISCAHIHNLSANMIASMITIVVVARATLLSIVAKGR